MSYFTTAIQQVFRGLVLISFSKITQLNTFTNLVTKPQIWVSSGCFKISWD